MGTLLVAPRTSTTQGPGTDGDCPAAGAAITTTILAGTANDDRWALIEVERSKLDIANDFDCVALEVAATGGSDTEMAVFFLGWRMRSIPPTYGSDKAEIVIVDG